MVFRRILISGIEKCYIWFCFSPLPRPNLGQQNQKIHLCPPSPHSCNFNKCVFMCACQVSSVVSDTL